jgi:hypothetical protein
VKWGHIWEQENQRIRGLKGYTQEAIFRSSNTVGICSWKFFEPFRHGGMNAYIPRRWTGSRKKDQVGSRKGVFLTKPIKRIAPKAIRKLMRKAWS